MTEPRKFAFGTNRVDDCSCPAIAAGYTEEDIAEDDTVHAVARYFDSVIYANTDNNGHGLVEEEVAKDASEQIMTRLEAGRVEDEYEVAQEVAENLGWQDE